MKFRLRITLHWTLVIWLALTSSAFACGDPAQAQAPAAQGTQQPQAQSTGTPPPAKLKYSRFHKVLARNLTTNLFTKGNLAPFLIGSAGALAIAPADQEIHRAFYNHAQGWGQAGGIIGGPVLGGFVGGSVVAGFITKNEHFRSFSYTLAQSYATATILTQGLKYATHRMRPDGSGSTSFPSGHTSDSFAVATVVSSYYGKKWGIPSYVLAGLIGVARVEQGRHWPSDAVAGAALGYISGKTAIRGTKRELAGKKTLHGLMITPLTGRDYRGVSVRLIY